MSEIRVEESAHLSDGEVSAVRALAGRAAETDGVDPISEAFRLALTSSRASVTHVLAYAGPSGPVGYAARDAAGSAELWRSASKVTSRGPSFSRFSASRTASM